MSVQGYQEDCVNRSRLEPKSQSVFYNNQPPRAGQPNRRFSEDELTVVLAVLVAFSVEVTVTDVVASGIAEEMQEQA